MWGWLLTSNRTPVRELEFTRNGTDSKLGATQVNSSYTSAEYPSTLLNHDEVKVNSV
jgi:hypothetical protein